MTNKEKKIFREMKDRAVNEYMLFRDDNDFDATFRKVLLNTASVYIEIEKALEIEY